MEVLGKLGQLPFGRPPPDGYPDVEAAWCSTATLLARWNTAQTLVRGQVRGLQPFDVDGFLGTPVPQTAGALVDRVPTASC